MADREMPSSVRIALWLIAAAIVLGLVGLIFRVLRWLLIVAAVLVLAAGAVRWYLDRDGT